MGVRYEERNSRDVGREIRIKIREAKIEECSIWILRLLYSERIIPEE